MKLDLSLRTAIVTIIFSFITLTNACASEKKGISLGDASQHERVALLNVSWYYTYGPQPNLNIKNKLFVPMIYGGNKNGRLQHQLGILSDVYRNSKASYLLSFNEPDEISQSDMTVEEALNTWKFLQPYTKSIGTPALAKPFDPWMDRFLEEGKKQNARIDFMAVHLYTPPNPALFLEILDSIYAKYKMPIWLTEFGVADWSVSKNRCQSRCINRYSDDETIAFMRAVLPELEKRSYIRRYAWFTAGDFALHNEHLKTSRLFDADGNMTALGTLYASF